MPELQHQICPWCQMEIHWDEEIGPEPYCPHCLNELSEYRTISLPLTREAREGPQSDDDWERYSRVAEQYLDAQEEVPECPQCQEYMVHAGEQLITETAFMPKTPLPHVPPFLKAPFRLDVFVCAHCFTVHQRLSERDRIALVRRLGEDEE